MNAAGIVLAAGAGRRMGGPKALLPFGGSTFLRSALDTLAAAGVARRIVVLDPRASIHADAARIARDAGAEVVDNPDAERGMLSSVRAGLAALAADSAITHAFVLPVDHPGVAPTTLTALGARALAAPHSIVVPTYGGRRGHPGLFPRSLFGEIAAAPDDVGARHVLHAHPDRVVEIPVDDPSAVRDVDVPADLPIGRASPARVKARVALAVAAAATLALACFVDIPFSVPWVAIPLEMVLLCSLILALLGALRMRLAPTTRAKVRTGDAAVVFLVTLGVLVGLPRSENARVRRFEHGFDATLKALERYHGERGRYPDSLDRLVPQYLAGTPSCPGGSYFPNTDGFRILCRPSVAYELDYDSTDRRWTRKDLAGGFEEEPDPDDGP